MSMRGGRRHHAVGAGRALGLAALLACAWAEAATGPRGVTDASRRAPTRRAETRPRGPDRPEAGGRLRGLLVPGLADTLADALRRLEADPEAGGEAAFERGQLHYARGEYGQARQSFELAQARLVEPRRSEARYREALSWLALGDAARARAAANALTGLSPWQEPALLLTAQSYELEGDLVRALTTYERVLDPPGRSDDPTSLGRAAALYVRLGRPERARQSAQLLKQLYPGSMEAAAARSVQPPALAPPAAAAGRRTIAVQIGSFAGESRARALMARARRAGFPKAHLVSQGSGEASTHMVSVGVYGTREEAVEAGRRAERLLGTAFWLVVKP